MNEEETVFEMTEELANSIVEISKAMEIIKKSRIKQKVLILLIHDLSKVGKRDIEYVLNSLSAIEREYLKPKSQSKE